MGEKSNFAEKEGDTVFSLYDFFICKNSIDLTVLIDIQSFLSVFM